MQNRTVPESGGILRGNPVDPTRAHFRVHRCFICCCFSSSDSRTNCGIVLVLSGAAHWRQIVDFPKPWRLSRTTGGGRNRGRDSLRNGGWLLAPKWTLSRLKNFLARRARPPVGRCTSSSTWREVLMAHFPASLSMSTQAGSSETQKVCRMTKSRNRTGSRAWRKSSAYRPPAHAVAAAGADSKDPEVHSAVKTDELLTKRAIPKVEVLYVVMGCSETSVLSSRRRRGAKPLAVAAATFEKTLRRLCNRLLRQRQDFEWSNSCGRPLLIPQRASSITAWYVLYAGREADKVAPNDSVARTIVAAKPSLAQKPKKCTTHLFRASRRRLCSAETEALWGPSVQPGTFPVSVHLSRLQSPESLVTTLQADTATRADSKDPARSASL